MIRIAYSIFLALAFFFLSSSVMSADESVVAPAEAETETAVMIESEGDGETPQEELLDFLDEAFHTEELAEEADTGLPPRSRSAEIIDTFKAEQRELLFENIPFTSEEERVLFEKDRRIFTLQQLVDRIVNAREQVEEQRVGITRKRITLQEYITELDISIARTEAEITDIQEKIAATNRSIGRYSLEIRQTQERIARDRKIMLDYLSHIYSRGELVYADGQDVDLIKTVIMNDGDIAEIFNALYHKTLLEATGRGYIERYRDLVAEYYYKKEALKEQKRDDLRMRAKLFTAQEDIELQRAHKQKILEITQGKEQIFEEYITKKIDAEAQARVKIQQVLDEYQSVYDDLEQRFGCENIADL